METFIKSGKNHCIIFEDDFTFTQEQSTINTLIDKIFNELTTFDVVILSGNIFKSEPTNYDFVVKIIDAQALSGYAVSKQFAQILLNNYRESIQLLEGWHIHDFCFDIYVKRIQSSYNWYCLNPKIGIQFDSYSDIEKRVVNYNC